MPADELPTYLAQRRAGVLYPEASAVGVDEHAAPVARIDTEPFHRRPAAHGQHVVDVGIGVGGNDPARRRQGAHQVVELALDVVQIVENIGVIEFDVVDDQGARVIVDELGSLVEEGAVVFVGLDHEGSPRVAADAGGYAEVFRHPAHQKSR